MAIDGNLTWRDGGSTSEEGILYALSQIVSTGRLGANHLQASQRSAGANMSIDISPGGIMIDSGLGYSYTGYLKQTGNLPITNGDSSNDRITLAVGYIDLAVQSTASNNNPAAFKIVAVDGDPAADPEHPSDSDIQTAVGENNPWAKIAEVLVEANNSSSIVDDDITYLLDTSVVTSEMLNNLPANSVDTAQVKTKAITAAKIADEFTNYSTSEVNTGAKWVDGKDIYKKTINFGALDNNTLKSVAHGITGFDRFIKFEGSTKHTSSGELLSLPYSSTAGTDARLSIAIDSNNIRIYSNFDATNYNAYITIYYTKT